MDNLHAVKFALRSGYGAQGLEQPSAIKQQHTHGTNGLDTILELGNVLRDNLQLKDESSGTSSESPSDEDGSSGLEDENISNQDLYTDGSTAMSGKCLHKSATFPASAGSEGNELESQVDGCKVCSRSLSMPSARKVVSAMKGTREKEGLPPKKRSVSWAPDVYDPPPSSVSHFPKKKNQQQYSKNHKKHRGKQKGKNVRGSGSNPKEKKHYRKSGGRSDRCMDSYAETDRVHTYKSSLELLDFNDPGIGSPDPNCGSKFLGQASGTMNCVY